MTGTRFRHAGAINPKRPQELRGWGSNPDNEPWPADYAKRVYNGELMHQRGEPHTLVAAIDDPSDIVLSKPRVHGMVMVIPPNNSVSVRWFQAEPAPVAELHMSFADIDKFSLDDPGVPRTLDGLDPDEREANAGRLRLTHVNFVRIAEPRNTAANWIIDGQLKARRQSEAWINQDKIENELTDYEDYGLVPEDLWFDYPEFDRYDHLIFRDSPALSKLGVPDEIRLKPIPTMPGEVVG